MLNRITSRVLAGNIGQNILRVCPDLITNIETDRSVAALTFDDGPHPVYTPRLLTILEKHGAKATFFMVGEAASRYPEIVRMVAKAGHAIGNHSWNHPNLALIRSWYPRMKQMWTCAKVTAPYAKRLFRPPYGAHNDYVRLDAMLFRYKVILWNVSAQDWIPQESEEIARKVTDRVTPGSIFLLHDAMCGSEAPDTPWDRGPMLDGLDKALVVLKRQIRFITVPELLRAGRPVSKWPLN